MGKGGGRPGNPGVWEHFTKLEGGKVKCNYCGHSFSAGGGTTRIKAHIHKLKGQGVRPCSAIIPQSDDEAKDQERIQVGSSFVSNKETEDLQVLKYVFQHLRPEDNVFISPLSHLTQEEFLTLIKPEAFLDSFVIDAFAEILTYIERKKKTTPSNWYLPVTFSTAAFRSDEANFKRLVRLRENYMSKDLNSCEKVFIPVHFGETQGGHFYLYIIHLKNKEIEIWDPLPNISLAHRHETTKKLLLAMEKLFEKVAFSNFDPKMAHGILLQPNGKKEREDLALKLIKSDMNQEKQKLYEEARRRCAQVEKKDGNKRLRVDTSDDERGNRHDDLQKGFSKGYLLPTTNLIGKGFQRCTQQIWKWIMDDKVSAIGVWGMGGSGKTTLATHIHNKLLEDEASRDMKVIWVTVSQNSISHLQKVMARSIELDISDELEVKRIAGKLLQAFKEMKKCVIILDDVWDHFFLKDIGFPVSDNQIKLILTTRIWEVCQGMDCEKNTVRVEPLDEEESLHLFGNIIGLDLPGEGMDGIVDAMAKVCEGLPLVIVRIATSMKGKYPARRMLECLQNLGYWHYEIDKWVLPVLRSSYDFLNEKSQRFFLYCVMSTGGRFFGNNGCRWIRGFDENSQSSLHRLMSTGGPFYGNNACRLIRRFAYESIDETKLLREQYDECYNMLDKLQNHGMLGRDDSDNKWSIHKYFRVLAIGIAEGAGKIMAYAYQFLTEIPSDDQWKEDLQEVFLTGNKIQTIPDGTCFRCSQLSTLLLDGNRNLEYISDEFFNDLPSLKTLDLSETGIKRLPESVSNLKFLIALLLTRCRKLCYIPSLSKLTRLISLDLSFTAVTEAPMGLDSLVNLRCLNLRGTVKLVMSARLIFKLRNLECLTLDVTAKLGIQGLKKLEVLVAYFRDISVFNNFASLGAKYWTAKSYHLTLGAASDDSYVKGINREYSMKGITFGHMELGNREIVLLGDIGELYIRHCRQRTGTTYLCRVLSCHNDDELKIERLDISYCDCAAYLCCVSPSCSFCFSSRLVGSLSLEYLEDLKYLVPPGAHSLDKSLFFTLTDLSIRECHSMKTLMTPRLLAHLQNLRTISVRHCEKMKEIVGDHSEMELPNLELRNLTSLTLFKMRELNSVYRGVMLCPSLQTFSAESCEQLDHPRIQIIPHGRALEMENTSEDGYRWEK